MESQTSRGGHLDATAGRDVVYCHACSREWWQDEHGLQCPHCESEITEIVSPENDPRLIEDGPALHESPAHDPRRRMNDDDSDPEEADIEEHLHRGPSGFVLHRARWDNSQRPGQSSYPNARQPPDPQDGDQIIRRFLDMVNEFGMGPPPRPPPEETRPPGFGGGGGLFGGGGNVRTIYRGGPGGTTSFTITTGPIHIHQGGANPPVAPGGDRFQSIFSYLLSEAGPPQPGGPGGPGGPSAPEQGQRAAGGAPTLLHEILNMLNQANAAHGDAVYSQEALDRIISTLMEQNPQSNAAPPATEDALKKLERKKVDQEMLGPDGKAECTICIDDFNEGDEVAVLPCKHWFHDQCVVMWLKEHNTCPICRTPIEQSSNNHNAAEASNANNSGNPAQRGPDAAPGSPGGSQSPIWDDMPPGMPGHWGAATFVARPFHAERAPPPVPSDSTRPARTPFSDWDVPFPSYGGDTASRIPDIPARPQQPSRMSSFRSRRDSHSPPSLWRHQSDTSRARQRSPSSGNWDRSRDHDDNQDSGATHGPLSWLRNQFSRGSNSGDGNARERRGP